jgi:predicted nucleic acid-binding Zn ribbon protein
VLTGTIVGHGKIYLDLTGDEGLHLHLFHARQSSEARMSDHKHEALHLQQQQHLSVDDKPALNPEQRCDRCGTPFSPRRGSGGSRQRFCSSECRLDFHTQRQRMERRAAYIAPTTLPATGVPRNPAVAALHPWETGVLDIASCDRTEFIVGLKESEAAGTRVETWPPEVRALIDNDVSRWVEEHKQTCTVRAVTVAAPRYDGIQSCVVILHHFPRE